MNEPLHSVYFTNQCFSDSKIQIIFMEIMSRKTIRLNSSWQQNVFTVLGTYYIHRCVGKFKEPRNKNNDYCEHLKSKC